MADAVNWNCDGAKGENGMPSSLPLNNHQTTLTTFGNLHQHHYQSQHQQQSQSSVVDSSGSGVCNGGDDESSSPPTMNNKKNGYLNSQSVVPVPNPSPYQQQQTGTNNLNMNLNHHSSNQVNGGISSFTPNVSSSGTNNGTLVNGLPPLSSGNTSSSQQQQQQSSSLQDKLDRTISSVNPYHAINGGGSGGEWIYI